MKFKLIHYSPLEKEVVSLFKTNLTQAEIAKKLGIGETTVAYRIKRLEVSNA